MSKGARRLENTFALLKSSWWIRLGYVIPRGAAWLAHFGRFSLARPGSVQPSVGQHETGYSFTSFFFCVMMNALGEEFIAVGLYIHTI